MEGLPKILLARWRGVPVHVDVTFILVPLLLFPWRLIPELASVDWAEVYVSRRLTMWLIAVTCTFASILLHEMAHAAVARRCGVTASAIQIGGFYGLAILPVTATLRRSLVPILAAGPLANVMIAACLWLALGMPEIGSRLDLNMPRVREPGTPLYLQSVWISGAIWLFQLNAAMAIYNLLPAFPLDGGRMARIGLRRLVSDGRAVGIVAVFGIVVGVWSMFGAVAFGGTLATIGFLIALFNYGIWRREVDAPDD